MRAACRGLLAWLNQSPSCCHQRLLSTVTDGSHPHVAIVGSGPAGFYTAQQLLKGHPTLRVDVYEKLPIPFGLVRFGVAPDHPEVKNCINAFTQTAHNARCQFLGHVEVGKVVTIAELKQAYTAVVLCHGASNDRKLGIPGEDLPNVVSARSFVGWYNGLPEDKDLVVNLDCDTAVVIGHGNVGLDVARILLTPVDILAKTDISQHALEKLSTSNIRRVVVAGRRGPLQTAFTIKELREMLNLPRCRTIIRYDDVADLKDKLESLPRPRRRLSQLLYTAGAEPSENHVDAWGKATHGWELRFLRSPVEIVKCSDSSQIEGVRFTVTKLEGDDPLNQKAVPTDEQELIPCGLVLRSIGYKGVPIDETIPFDKAQGIVPNINGRVTGSPGLYCSGWIGQGPVGVILGTMNDSFSTAKLLLQDISNGKLPNTKASGSERVIPLLLERGVTPVYFHQWEKVDKVETVLGAERGKPREKITSLQEMLQIAWSPHHIER